MGGLILALGAGTVLWVSLHDKQVFHDKLATLPTGQNYYPITLTLEVKCETGCGPDPALQKLQWLADESRCHVSDNPALMAGCVRERIAKVRAKALAYKERYEELRDLDFVYFQNLHREGLVPYTTHVPKDVLEQSLQ